MPVSHNSTAPAATILPYDNYNNNMKSLLHGYIHTSLIRISKCSYDASSTTSPIRCLTCVTTVLYDIRTAPGSTRWRRATAEPWRQLQSDADRLAVPVSSRESERPSLPFLYSSRIIRKTIYRDCISDKNIFSNLSSEASISGSRRRFRMKHHF